MADPSTWGPTADLIDDLEAAGFGYGPVVAQAPTPRAGSRRQVVTLPDGTTAERTTRTPARWAVAVLDWDRWVVLRWVVRSQYKLNEAEAVARRNYPEVVTLDVEVKES